ncbi:MAG: FtsW/RodA/SpoVE family cell cycle protein [Anaerolineae bacterium]|nr:FtsW/RodA/SpoVE family cell cycle protein [Anaerolineae bacterium]
MSTQPFKRIQSLQDNQTLMSAILMACAGLFVIIGLWTLDAVEATPSLTRGHLMALLGGWTVSWAGTCWLLKRKLHTCDPLIIPVVALLTGWGLLVQARLAPRFMLRQLVWLFLGNVLLCVIAITPNLSRMLRRYRYTILTCGLVLLAATLFFGVNPSGYGQQLWLGAFGFYMQPSEPLKLLMIIYLAAYLSDRRELTNLSSTHKRMWFVVLGPMLVMVGTAMVLLLWQQDLGAALLFYLTFTAMLYLTWGRVWYIIISLVLFIPVALSGYFLSSRVALRVSIWLNPWLPENADRAFQILQSLFALGSGGIVGQGLGQGYPTLIPAVHTDFIYAAVAEEFGYIGIVALLILITILTSRGLALAQKTRWPFEALLAGGIAAMISIQMWVITGGNAKLIPITGVTLPFLSYGGSSLVTMLAAVGLLINLSAPHPPPVIISLKPVQSHPVRISAARLGHTMMALMLSIAIITGFWSIHQNTELAQNVSNPRLILSEQRIQRGQILDRHAKTLASIEVDDAGYVTRVYPVPEAAPVVGYATIDHGAAGIEAACDDRLRGNFDTDPLELTWAQILHQDPQGQDVRLTIDANMQKYAYEQLSDVTGAAVLMDAHSGELLVLASSPTYNPANVEENWAGLRESPNAPLLNRATQGLAQPGGILETVILASFWDEIQDISPSSPVTASVELNGYRIECQTIPSSATWQSVYASACPGPFSHLDALIDNQALQAAFDTWQLTEAPQLELATLASDWSADSISITNEIMGQGSLLVTPLHMVSVVAVIGNEGKLASPHLLQTPLPGCSATAAQTETGTYQIIEPDIAELIRNFLPDFEQTIGHRASALAGPNRVQSWFIGLNSRDVPRYAVAVLVDSATPSSIATRLGVNLLQIASGAEQIP